MQRSFDALYALPSLPQRHAFEFSRAWKKQKHPSSYATPNKYAMKTTISIPTWTLFYLQATGLHHLYVAEIVGPNGSFCGSVDLDRSAVHTHIATPDPKALYMPGCT